MPGHASIFHLAPTEFRFFAKVDFTDNCWIWRAATTPEGYGQFWGGVANKRLVFAHRWSYAYFYGCIPSGLYIDHLCRVTPCVRPDHLEAVTNQENTLRGLRGRMLTHCVNGHAITPENTYVRPRTGRRECHPCKVIAGLKYRTLRFSGGQVKSGEALALIERALEASRSGTDPLPAVAGG